MNTDTANKTDNTIYYIVDTDFMSPDIGYTIFFALSKDKTEIKGILDNLMKFIEKSKYYVKYSYCENELEIHKHTIGDPLELFQTHDTSSVFSNLHGLIHCLYGKGDIEEYNHNSIEEYKSYLKD